MAQDTSNKIEEQRAGFYELFTRPIEQVAADLESPIERLLFWALLNTCLECPVVDWLPLDMATEHAVHRVGVWWLDIGTDARPISLLPQAEVLVDGKRYRIDFLIRMSTRHGGVSLAETFVAVECDGHEFHEKTKEQAKRDKARDRALQSIGFHVAHFTGSEIFQDPQGAAGEIIKFVYGVHEPAHRRAIAGGK